MNSPKTNTSISDALETVLARYEQARKTDKFGSSHPIWSTFSRLEADLEQTPLVRSHEHLRVAWGVGQGKWAWIPWIALLDERVTTSIQEGVYVVFLFRQDMSGVYLTLNQGVTNLKTRHGTKEARSILRGRAKQLGGLLPEEQDRFRKEGIDLHTDAARGRQYEASTAAYRFYEAGAVPDDDELLDDLAVLVEAYDRYVGSDLARKFHNGGEADGPEPLPPTTAEPPPDFDLLSGAERLHSAIRARGFVYDPWQIAQYVTAVRTKPFVILAGVTGTGKSKLPRLVAEATGGDSQLVPVRPDWTDSAEVLGYTDLQGVFRPGAVLEAAHEAKTADDVHWTCIVDEMNLARVEHYFAEVLSRIEDRRPAPGGGYSSSPLVSGSLSEEDAEWGKVDLPPNLAIVGTVNMDESAHGFSRKVLDRAFTLELSDVDLTAWRTGLNETVPRSEAWPVSAWWPRATRLSELKDIDEAEESLVKEVVQHLVDLNEVLTLAQLQVGYRTRDEVAVFLIHAEEIRALFRTELGDPVDPLDLVIQMKILPRIAGGSSGVRRVLLGLLGWSYDGASIDTDAEARERLDRWDAAGRPSRIAEARFPGVAGRVLLMWDRLQSEGFTAYWL